MFKKLKNRIEMKKHDLFVQLIKELKTFLINNSNNLTLDKRIFSLYYFISCHSSFDDVIITLNRFLQSKKFYTFGEIMIVRLLKFKLEAPLFWINRIIRSK